MEPSVWCHGGQADREPLHYTACGLDNVYLVSGYDIHKTPYGEGISVKDLDQLHEAIGRYLASQKKDLSGKELRYLRKEMDLTQSELGRLIGLSYQQVARWEKEESEITGPADLLVRALYLESVDKRFSVRDLAEAIGEMDSKATGAANEPAYFENADGWKKASGQN